MYGISNELGIRILNDTMCYLHNESVIGCQALKWDAFMRRYSSIPTFFNEIDYSSHKKVSKHIDIQNMTDEELVDLISHIAQQCAGSATLPTPETVLLDLGLDSLGAVEFRNTILDLTAVKLPQTLVFENPTIATIAHYVRQNNFDENSSKDQYTNNSQLQSNASNSHGSIEQWLLSSLKQSERYLLYLESFNKRYSNFTELIAETDIFTALEDIGVENHEDFDLLYVSWNEIITIEENTKKPINEESTEVKIVDFYNPSDDVANVVSNLNINLENIEPATAPENIQLALLTGVTGFVGRILLVKLLEYMPHLNVICLVRSSSPKAGLERIITACSEAEIWNPKFISKIIVECGDFEQNFLGLSEERYNELCKQVDIVYHIGGDVNLLSNYKRLRKTNSLSISGIIEFCSKVKIKHLHFSSTLGQFPAFFAMFTREFSDSIVSEFDGPNTKEMNRLFPPSRQGYPWSKWAAEQILEFARSKGLPVTIYRLPNTYVASDTGFTNKTDYATSLLIASICEGIFPIGSTTAPLTPVNTICDMIVLASFRNNRKYWRYNLIDTRILTRSDIENWARELGLVYYGVNIDKFLTAIKERGPESPIFKFVPLMQYWRHYWFDNKERTEPFPVNSSNILEDIPEIKWPSLRETFCNSFLYATRHGYFPAKSKAIRYEIADCIDDALFEMKTEFINVDEFKADNHNVISAAKQIQHATKKCDLTFFGKYSSYLLIKQSLINQYILHKMKIPQNTPQCIFVTGLSYDVNKNVRNHIKRILGRVSELKFVDIVCPYNPNSFSKKFMINRMKMSQICCLLNLDEVQLDEQSVVQDDALILEILLMSPFSTPLIYGEYLQDYQTQLLQPSKLQEVYSSYKYYISKIAAKYNYNDPLILSSPFHLGCINEILNIFENCKIVVVLNKQDYEHQENYNTESNNRSLITKQWETEIHTKAKKYFGKSNSITSKKINDTFNLILNREQDKSIQSKDRVLVLSNEDMQNDLKLESTLLSFCEGIIS
ncbi:type I fatty acid synthase [Cryptosporidium andersoni]|uniref:Type I fatty acid synthase n=1 Tax=Cryptosporidium andersoni TaxID=117008 RepID=A0A1J4MQY7_9CRYT|nr:type I fatty acid synthase [Cryptosporidium andersoni]